MKFFKNISAMIVTLIILGGVSSGVMAEDTVLESQEISFPRIDFCHVPAGGDGSGILMENMPITSWLGHKHHDGDFLIEDEEDRERCVGDENTPPVITLLGDNPLTVIQGNSYTDPGATADDNEDGDITGDIVVGGDVVDTGTLGSYFVTYNVQDSDGADAIEEVREVTVTQLVRRSSGGGGRKKSSSSSSGEVLGAFTGDSPSCGMYLNSYMKIGLGNNPNEVKKLQSFLNEQGIPVPVTGLFGPLTDGAVKQFQFNNRLKVLVPWGLYGFSTDPTGYVFKLTRHTINDIVCPGSEPYPLLP